jgi:hypothetical protein
MDATIAFDDCGQGSILTGSLVTPTRSRNYMRYHGSTTTSRLTTYDRGGGQHRHAPDRCPTRPCPGGLAKKHPGAVHGDGKTHDV